MGTARVGQQRASCIIVERPRTPVAVVFSRTLNCGSVVVRTVALILAPICVPDKKLAPQTANLHCNSSARFLWHVSESAPPL